MKIKNLSHVKSCAASPERRNQLHTDLLEFLTPSSAEYVLTVSREGKSFHYHVHQKGVFQRHGFFQPKMPGRQKLFSFVAPSPVANPQKKCKKEESDENLSFPILTHVKSLDLTDGMGLLEHNLTAIFEDLSKEISSDDVIHLNLSKYLPQLQSAEKLSFFLGCFPNTTSLDMSYCDQITVGQMEAIAECYPDLRSIDFSGSVQIKDATLLPLKNCKELSLLNLKHCHKITDRAIASLAECKTLTSINLSYCGTITRSAIATLARNCPRLSIIDLSGCKEISTDLVLQLSAICKTLKCIHFKGNGQIRESAIADLLKKHDLTSITLPRFERITDNFFRDFPKLPNLSSLDLSSCDGISEKGAEALAEKCPNLIHISFAMSNRMENQEILAVVTKFRCLIKIDLSWLWNLSTDTVEKIALHSPELREINLQHCTKITDAALKALSNHCPNLSLINLSFCSQISEKEIHRFQLKLTGTRLIQ